MEEDRDRGMTIRDGEKVRKGRGDKRCKC